MNGLGGRTFRLVLGGLLLAIAALLLTAFGSLSNLRVGDRTLFAFPTGAGQSLFRLDAGDNLTQRISIEIDDGIRVSITAQGASDQLARAVARGAFRESPEVLATYYLADLDLVGEQAGRLVWTPPIVIDEGTGPDEIIIKGSYVDLDHRPESLRIDLQCSDCPTQIKVTSPKIDLIGVEPDVVVEQRDANELSVDVGADTLPDGLLTIHLKQRQVADVGDEVDLPPDLTRWWFGFARSVWPLALWFVMWPALAKLQPQSPAMSRVRSFVLLGVLTATAVTVSAVSDLTQSLAPDSFTYDGTKPLQIVVYRLSVGNPVPALSAMFLVWALAARPSRGRRRVFGAVGALALVLAGVALTQVLNTAAPLGPGVALGWPVGLLSGGVVLAIVGSGFVVAAAGRSGIGATLAGAGTVIAISVLSATYSSSSQWGAGLLTLACGAFALTCLVLITADLVGLGWLSGRARLLTVLLVGLLMVAAAYPSFTVSGNLSPVSAYDAWSTSSVLTGLLPLALEIAAAALLVRATRAASPSRLLIVGLSAVLLLRSEVQYVGIPWAFLVGLLLISVVLLPDRSTTSSGVGPSQDEIDDRVRERVRQAAVGRTARELRETMRRKIASADAKATDAAAVQQTVEDAGLGTTTTGSAASPDKQALDWSSWPDPSGRAVRGLVVASALGAVLSFSYLLRSLGYVDGVAGARNAFAVVDATAAFKFPWYGLAFGCLLPFIPGSTALLKAARLFVVIAASEVLVISVPLGAEQTKEAIVLRLLQLALMCTVLGVLFDLGALHRAGLSMSDLGDLYATNRAVIWSSGIAVAVATATATALLGSATSLLIERIVPAPAPPPAQGTQNPGGSTGSQSP